MSNAQAKKAAIDGSFVTEDLCRSWSDARWQQEFTMMKDAGMHYVIIAYVVQSFPGLTAKTSYPSSLPNTEMMKGEKGIPYPDIVDACLRNAQIAGMKVFIGLDLNDRWWSLPADDSTWLYSQMDFDNSVCDEVWKLYKDKYPDAFYGWYWTFEADNANFRTNTQQRVLTTAMNRQIDHLIAMHEKLPFMWCPFMNSILGSPELYEAMWKNVFAGLHTTPGDIFCPQDCVGAGGLKLHEVERWFAALRAAVATKPGLLMWSDVETFDLSDNTTATMDRIVSQLKIEQPYVDDYITWEYSYYDSPYNINPGFHTTYVDYLKTGALETSLPTAPTNFQATLQPDGDVALHWDAATDNIGVCGYYVYRNGTMICKKQVPVHENREAGKSSLTSLTDFYLLPKTNYAYEVKAYDFANNLSPSTPVIIIKTGENPLLPNNVSAGCFYTTSIPDNFETPGQRKTKLTDGIYADSASIGDAAWEGFHDSNQKPREVVIDLGRVTPVQQFIADFLSQPKVMVYLPAEVSVSVSKDSTVFTEVGKFHNPNCPRNDSAVAFKYRMTLPAPIDARYVKFITRPADRWFDEITYEDEFEVRNNETDNKK